MPSKPPELLPPQAVYDCIEVESPSSSQQPDRAASTASPDPAVSKHLKRGGGRQKKIRARSEMPGPAGQIKSLDEYRQNGSQEPKIEVYIPFNRGNRQKPPPVSAGSDGSPSHPKDHQDQESDAAIASTSDPTRRCGSLEVKPDDQENQVTPEETRELLQQALSTLRRTSMSRSELRAIDDLVFEIRTEAQNAAQRREKIHT